MIFTAWIITSIAYTDECVYDNIHLSQARRIPCAARVWESGNRRASKHACGGHAVTLVQKARDKLTVFMPGAG